MNASGRDVMNDAAPCRPARTAVAPSCFGPFELHSDVRQGFVFCPRVNRATIDGEGLNISIRGMGANFARVLLNGAPMASASAGHWGGTISANREVDMDFLPSELFRSATVYKSQRASVLEGGIAGTVDMRSVRPFDKQGLRSAFTVSGNYRDQVGKWSDTGSALVSNTWRNSTLGDFGVLVGAAWGRTNYKTTGFQTVDMRNGQLK